MTASTKTHQEKFVLVPAWVQGGETFSKLLQQPLVHWSAEISGDQRRLVEITNISRDDGEISLLRRPPTHWSHGSLSLASSSCWVFCSEIGFVPGRDVSRAPQAGGCSPSSGQFILGRRTILQQNAGPMSGQSSIMGREEEGRGEQNLPLSSNMTDELQLACRHEGKWNDHWPGKQNYI